MTPEQMRALASLSPGNKMLYATEIAAALEYAADQLEAVQAWARVSAGLGGTPHWAGLGSILTADTAPQSDRIEDVMQRNWNRRYGADAAPQENRDE